MYNHNERLNVMDITFREIVKLIHPDSNPYITNASEKMNDVMMHRNNPRALWNLAVRWGLVGGESNVSDDRCWDTGVSVGWSTYWEV